jgi:hypothetical protein
MMSAFWIYLQLGIEHILDPQGIDHMLFVITLCAIYQITQWKRVLVLVTAFTLGHSVTLALSGLKMVNIDQDLIETLIPITIFCTALLNIASKNTGKALSLQYLIALGFGLIHGLGFSNYFKALMADSNDVLFPLFSFNLGIELGQLLIVFIFGLLLYLATHIKKIKHRDWNLVISGAAAGISLMMILEKLMS